jgi:hypothetical protein
LEENAGDFLEADFWPGTISELHQVLRIMAKPRSIARLSLWCSQVGTIAIRAMLDGDQLVLTVVDNGVGVPAEWSGESNIGIGLSSTRERLSRIFPGDHQFVLRKLDEGGTEVRIAIPYLRKDQPCQENIPSEQLASVDR